MPWSYSLVMASGSAIDHCSYEDIRSLRSAAWGRLAISCARAMACSRAVARGDDAVGEAHPQRFVPAHAPPGQDEVEGVAVAEQPGQSDGAAVHERDPPSPAVDAEHGVDRGHAQVAPGGQLQAARHGVALDRGDDGFASSIRVGPTGRRRRARRG